MVAWWLITGASRGIGLRIAQTLVGRGEHVVVTCRSAAPALEELHNTAPERVSIQTCDVGNDDSVRQLFESISALNVRFQCVVNNAGMFLKSEGAFGLNAEVIGTTHNVNVLGCVRVTAGVLPFLEEHAKIVNISSMLGSLALKTSHGEWSSYAYNMSKCGVNMFSRMLALEHQGKYCVLSIHPGWVATDMGGEEAPVTPQQSAEGIISVIDAANMKSSGSFLSYTGEVMPW